MAAVEAGPAVQHLPSRGQAVGSSVTFDLGHPHAATTHARTALHCAEVSGHTPLRAFIRCVQSNFASWDGRYHDAAQLVESALTEVTSRTTLLRLASQQARINTARRQPGDVSCALGSTNNLNAAVNWAHTALTELTDEPQPRVLYIATARFVLASAHLARGDLEAVGAHVAPVLHSTQAEYRTVPVISRARSLNALLAQRPDLVSSTLVALRDDLAEFCTHPAPTPAGPEPDATT
ncbi:MAG: hypothetical protein ACRDQ4_25800 [Pseudonocardiaceae bacterium]